MTRQCLYCTKELPKNSASNFCSKECWTEYKKLKAMNVDSDKQATVLLKRSDMPASVPDAPKNNVSAAITDTAELSSRIEVIEKMLNEKIFEIEHRAETEVPQPSQLVDNSSVIDELSSRILKIESDVHVLEDQAKAIAKISERLSSLETKIRILPTETPQKKKGFFARLFG